MAVDQTSAADIKESAIEAAITVLEILAAFLADEDQFSSQTGFGDRVIIGVVRGK